MTDNIKLPPLLDDGQMFTEEQMQNYARKAVRLNDGRPPEGYALVSVEVLRTWGKLDEVRECCRYLKHATPQPARVDDETLPAAHPAITHCDNCGCDWLDNGINPIGCPYCKQLEYERSNAAQEGE